MRNRDMDLRVGVGWPGCEQRGTTRTPWLDFETKTWSSHKRLGSGGGAGGGGGVQDPLPLFLARETVEVKILIRAASPYPEACTKQRSVRNKCRGTLRTTTICENRTTMAAATTAETASRPSVTAIVILIAPRPRSSSRAHHPCDHHPRRVMAALPQRCRAPPGSSQPEDRGVRWERKSGKPDRVRRCHGAHTVTEALRCPHPPRRRDRGRGHREREPRRAPRLDLGADP